MTAKPPIILAASTQHSLARIAAAQPKDDDAKKDTSVAAMLNQLHGVACMLLQEMAVTEAPIGKRLAMAKDMAKLLPLLATAERKVRKGWRNKDVEDMTDSELERARKALKVRQIREPKQIR